MGKILSTLLGMLLIAAQLLAQNNRTITGKITDEAGNPIANASILIKGTQLGTSSNASGVFSISVPADAKTLVVSSVSYATQEISLSRTTTVINAQLKGAEGSLSEVVVVGYGSQKRTDVASSVAKVAGDKVANIPLSSVDQILQGKVAGLQSQTFSGQPGQNQQIRIRGTGSFSVSSQPLYVVDGIQINSGDLSRLTTTSNVLSNINPDDIESISVLKDAAATAIYGSRGGNGVIVITTKRGRSGKTQFNLTAEVGFNKLGNVPPTATPVNSTQWFTLYKEAYLNAGGTQAGLSANLASFGDTTGNTSIDWLHTVTRTGAQRQYNLSASGGDEKTKFYISGGYFKQEAATIASDLTRYSVVANLDHNAGKRLSFALKLQPTYSKENAPLSNGSQFANPILSSFFLRPMQNPYNADGSLNIGTANKDFASIYNPLYLAENNQHSLSNFNGIGSGQVKYNILDNLSFTSKLGVQYATLEEYQYDNPFHGDGKASNGRGYSYYTRYFLYDWVNQFDYHGKITEKLSLNATAATEAILSKGYFISAQSQNYSTPRLPLSANASTVTIGSATASDYAFTSLFGTASFNYDGKYILAGTIRRDGSSRFGLNNQYGTFPSVSAAWNISKEGFFEPLSFISDMKLRASIGSAGNAEVSNYGAKQTFGFGANYNNQPGGTFNTLGNTSLTWEKDNQFDIGADISFLKNRVGLIFDYYNRVSSGLLFGVPLSQVSGFSTITENVGKLQNRGVEITINATPIQTKDFTWDLNFNFTHNKNQLKTLPPGQTQIINGQFLVKPGLDINTWYMRQWAGVDPATGNPLWYVDSSKTTATSNYSNTSFPNVAQRVNTGKQADPKFYGGFSNTFNLKGFIATIDLYYNFGNYVWDQWGSFLADETNPTYGKYSLGLQRWQKPGDITNVPKLYYGAANLGAVNGQYIQNSASNSTSTRFLYRGDFIRLRNVSVGYKIDKNLASRLHMSSLYFYVRGTNLWTKTYDKNLTIDPEQGGSSTTNSNVGTNNLNLFYNKAITVGINVGF